MSSSSSESEDCMEGGSKQLPKQLPKPGLDPDSSDQSDGEEEGAEEEEDDQMQAFLDVTKIGDETHCYRGLSKAEAAAEAREASDAMPFSFYRLDLGSIVQILSPDMPSNFHPGEDFEADRMTDEAPSGLLLARRSVASYLITRNAAVDLDHGFKDGKAGGIIWDLLGRQQWKAIHVYAVNKSKRGKFKDITMPLDASDIKKVGVSAVFLKRRKRRAKESGVTRFTYTLETDKGKVASNRIFVEMVTDNAKPWSTAMKRRNASGHHGNLAKKMRPSEKYTQVNNLVNAKRKSVSTAASKYYKSIGGVENAGPTEVFNVNAVEEAYRRAREASGLTRDGKGGSLSVWNETKVRKALLAAKDFTLESQFESDVEKNMGWRLGFTYGPVMDCFERCVLVNHPRFADKFSSYMFSDQTFEEGFTVHTMAFADPLFYTKNDKPVVSFCYLFLTERRTLADFEWVAAQVKLSIRRRLKKPGLMKQIYVRAYVTDGDAQALAGLHDVEIFEKGQHCLCQLHVASNVAKSINEFDPKLVLFSKQLHVEVFGFDKTDDDGNRYREPGLVDHTPDLMRQLWEGQTYPDLRREIRRDVYGPPEEAEERLDAFEAWVDKNWEHYLSRLISSYNLESRAPFFPPGAPIGKITNNALESMNPELHRRLSGRMAVHEAIPHLVAVFEEDTERKKMALLGLGGTRRSGWRINPKFAHYEMRPEIYVGLGENRFVRLSHVQEIMPSVAAVAEGEAPEEEGPKLIFKAADLGVPLMTKDVEASLDATAAEHLKKSKFIKGDDETNIVKDSNGKIVCVTSNGGDMFECQANKCALYEKFKVCAHIMFVVHHLGHESVDLLKDIISCRAASSFDVIRSKAMFCKAGRKAPEHFAHVGQKTTAVKPLTAAFETPMQEMLRKATQYAETWQLHVPSAEQLALLVQARPNAWQPNIYPFHNGDKFTIHTFESARRCLNISDPSARHCPACFRRLSEPDGEAPGDLAILHTEVWMEPKNRGSPKKQYQMLEAAPMSTMAAGRHWEKQEAAMGELGASSYGWSRNKGKRLYHCRFNCLLGRHPYVEKSQLELSPAAKFDHCQLAWLRLQLDIKGVDDAKSQ